MQSRQTEKWWVVGAAFVGTLVGLAILRFKLLRSTDYTASTTAVVGPQSIDNNLGVEGSMTFGSAWASYTFLGNDNE
jgi:hypothetical protein